jgi:hypothetical protein
MTIPGPQLRRLMATFLTKSLEISENRQQHFAVTIKTLEDTTNELRKQLAADAPDDLDDLAQWARVREEVQEAYDEATDTLLTIHETATSLRASLVKQRRFLIACASSEDFASIEDEVDVIVDKWFSMIRKKRSWAGTKDDFLHQLTEETLVDLLE